MDQFPSNDNESNTNNKLPHKPFTPPPQSPIDRVNRNKNGLDDLSSDEVKMDQIQKTTPKQRIKQNNNQTNDKNSSIDYDSKTLNKLKDLCKEKGLKVGGNKANLIERLNDPDNEIHKRKKSPKKRQQKRKTKRKKRDSLMIDRSDDERDSEGSVGSLKDFVVDNTNTQIQEIDSDEDYMMEDDEEDEYMDSDCGDDISDSFSATMNFQTHKMQTVQCPPNRTRRGTRTVCDIVPLCQWGAKCYRKNKQHQLEYAHPWKR